MIFIFTTPKNKKSNNLSKIENTLYQVDGSPHIQLDTPISAVVKEYDVAKKNYNLFLGILLIVVGIIGLTGLFNLLVMVLILLGVVIITYSYFAIMQMRFKPYQEEISNQIEDYEEMEPFEGDNEKF